VALLQVLLLLFLGSQGFLEVPDRLVSVRLQGCSRGQVKHDILEACMHCQQMQASRLVAAPSRCDLMCCPASLTAQLPANASDKARHTGSGWRKKQHSMKGARDQGRSHLPHFPLHLPASVAGRPPRLQPWPAGQIEMPPACWLPAGAPQPASACKSIAAESDAHVG
jgi:hypothetical protein